MLAEQPFASLRKRLMVPLLVQVCLLGLLVLYAVVVLQRSVTPEEQRELWEQSGRARLPAMAALAVLVAAVGVVIRLKMLAPAKLARPDDTDLSKACRRWLIGSLVSGLLFVSVGVYGVVLALTGGGIGVYLAFALPMAALLVVFLPRPASFRDRVEAGQRQRAE